MKTTYQDLWGAAKAVFRGKFIALHGYFRIKQTKHSNTCISVLTNSFNESVLSTWLWVHGPEQSRRGSCPFAGRSLLRDP